MPKETTHSAHSKLTQTELESHLWVASNILRGSIDSGDYKHYIFALLFYKRLCDVWNEEYEELLENFQGNTTLAAAPQKHRFHIPFGCMWSEELRPSPSNTDIHDPKLPATIRQWPNNVGIALDRAFRQIEASNPRLQGVFKAVDFSNQDRFSDDMLVQLLQHFEKCRMRTCDVDANILGNAYEYLIAKFADDAGKKGGEFYTPKEVVRLMVEILKPQADKTLYDPTCGSGGMLLEAMHYMSRQQQDAKQLQLYGQEKNINTWAICKMSLFLHDMDNAFIERGDTILEPKHLTKDQKLKQFDIILANPPFSLKNWGHHIWNSKAGDPYKRTDFGIPPKGYGDYAFIQHMIASLSPQGKIGIVVPMGVLFRGGKEQPIRQRIIEEDMIEAIVGLGTNLFYGAAIPAAVIFLAQQKPKHLQGKVLFVNAENEVEVGLAQNHLSQQHIRKIAEVVSQHQEVPLFSRLVANQEIQDNSYNLNIIRYVQTHPPTPPIDVAAEYQQLLSLKKRLDQEYQQVDRLLKGLLHD